MAYWGWPGPGVGAAGPPGKGAMLGELEAMGRGASYPGYGGLAWAW